MENESLFEKAFGVAYNGARSYEVSQNPTMGLSIALYNNATGNATTQKKAKPRPSRQSPVRSRKERYNQ